MIGIIGAMDIEVSALQSQLANVERQTFSGIEFISGTLHGMSVVVAKCGIGKVFAAMCAQTMCLKYPVTAIINTGVAGTLSPELGIGDVAISKHVVQHDMDTSAIGDPVGLISGINMVYLEADETLSRLAYQSSKALGRNTLQGTIATGDQFLCREEQRDFIRSTYSAIAGEMEGGSIGQVCYVNQIPFVVIRVISDDADGNSPKDYPVFAKEAADAGVAITVSVIEALSALNQNSL